MNTVPAPVAAAMENVMEEANDPQNPVQGGCIPDNSAGVPPVLEGTNTALSIYDTITTEEFRTRLEHIRDGVPASPVPVQLVVGDINDPVTALNTMPVTDQQLQKLIEGVRDAGAGAAPRGPDENSATRPNRAAEVAENRLGEGSADPNPVQPQPEVVENRLGEGSADPNPAPLPQEVAGSGPGEGSADPNPVQPQPEVVGGRLGEGSADPNPAPLPQEVAENGPGEGSTDPNPVQPQPEVAENRQGEGSPHPNPVPHQQEIQNLVSQPPAPVQSNPISSSHAASQPEPQPEPALLGNVVASSASIVVQGQDEVVSHRGENLHNVELVQGIREVQPNPSLGRVASLPATGVQGRMGAGSHSGVGGASSRPATVPPVENVASGSTLGAHGSQRGREGRAPPPITRTQLSGFAPFEVVNWLEGVGFFKVFRTQNDQDGIAFRDVFATQGIAGTVLLDIDMHAMRTLYGMNAGQAHRLSRIVRDLPSNNGAIYFFPFLLRRIY